MPRKLSGSRELGVVARTRNHFTCDRYKNLKEADGARDLRTFCYRQPRLHLSATSSTDNHATPCSVCRGTPVTGRLLQRSSFPTGRLNFPGRNNEQTAAGDPPFFHSTAYRLVFSTHARSSYRVHVRPWCTKGTPSPSAQANIQREPAPRGRKHVTTSNGTLLSLASFSDG